MNFDEIQQAWQSPQNQPSVAQLESAKVKFLSDLKRRRRGTVLFMGWVFLVMAVFTWKVVSHLLWPDPSKDPIHLEHEWGVLLLFALPWLGLILLYRQYRRHRARHQNCGRSIGDSLRALLDENRLARQQKKWSARIGAALLVLMPLQVYQLRAAGKAGDEILMPAFVLLPALLLGIYAGMAWYDRHTLLPRQRELEALLASYGEAEPAGASPDRPSPP